MRIGVNVTTSELPPASGSQFNTGAAYMVGRGDSGPVGQYVQCLSISDVTNAIGPRSSTNSVLWDSADVYFREGGGILYISRVVGPSGVVNASITLQDAAAHPTVFFTATYPGAFGNTLEASVVVSSPNYTVLVEDSNGNTLETHGPYLTSAGNAPLLASASAYGAFTQASGSGFTSAAPTTLAATALTGGADNYSSATLTNWQAALAAFTLALGPGQVSAPGMTNTALSGIWSALGVHAQTFNRVAICDMRDQQTATTVITDLGSFGTSGVGSYCAFWAGQVLVPSSTGTPGVTRTVPASAVISALCAQVDATGNPNQAAAGDSYPLQYVQQFTGTLGAPLYGQSDIDTLNAAGVNTWNTVFGVRQNYGFSSSVLQSTDTIYWQFNHARLRMSLEADSQVIGQPFVFSQLSQTDITAFGSDLAANAADYVTSKAFSTIAPDGSTDQGFVVNTASPINTATTMAAGQLNAVLSYRPAPFAQLVDIQLAAVPATANL
jgi:hypothetical protein